MKMYRESPRSGDTISNGEKGYMEGDYRSREGVEESRDADRGWITETVREGKRKGGYISTKNVGPRQYKKERGKAAIEVENK